MAILNYSTTINPMKTIGEISQCLVEHGANKISVDYEGNLPVSLTFQIIHNGRPIFFCLPARWENVLSILKTQDGVPKSKKTSEQAIRTAWRIIKVWVEAQMALIQAELASTPEIFLPYAITKTGKTLFEDIGDQNILLSSNTGA